MAQADGQIAPTRDEGQALIRGERRRVFRFKLALIIVGLGSGLLGALAARLLSGRPHTGGLQDTITLWRAPIPLWTILVVGLAVAATAGGLTWRYRPGAGVLRLIEVPGQRDRMQNGLARWLFITPLCAVAGVFALPALIGQILAGHAPLIVWVMTPALTFAYPYMILASLLTRNRIGRALDDELTRALRAQAFTVGFVVAMIALAGLFWLGLYRPAWMVEGLPAALLICATVPAWTYAFLNWRAERDG